MNRFKQMALVGLWVAALALGASGARAASLDDRIADALAKKDFTALRELTTQGPSAIDEVVRATLKAVLDKIASDPATAQAEISFAATYAPQISPPTVPAVCADLRRVAQAVPAEKAGTALHEAVMKAAQSFANAPVVVAAGRPNLCEEAWLQIAALAGEEDPLLFQSMGYRPQRPINPDPPPHNPPQPVNPSAD